MGVNLRDCHCEEALLRRWLKSLKIVIPWLDPLLYERLNKEVKILSFRGYDHFSPAYNIIKRF
ncbi:MULTISPECIES: hypothetical protein [unclassified Rickettsia]|uniref:hypothetical protein n=1 Tax=unclassified Rickettsia TaxID=114295 RepID=UPI0031332E01